VRPGTTRSLVAVIALVASLGVAGPVACAAGGAPSSTIDPATATSLPATTVPAGSEQLEVTTGNTYYRDSPTFDVYRPADDPGILPALIMIHGGAWYGSDGEALVPWAERAALQEHWAVFSVNYRLSSSDPVAWADELHDVQAAIRTIVVNADRWRIDSSGVLLLGDSAGANLAALVSEVGTSNPIKGSPVGGARDLNVPLRAVALWSPPTDLAPLVPVNGASPAACSGDPACDFAWNGPAIVDYLGCEPSQCPLSYVQASPISWVSPRVAPTYLAGATHELVPLDQMTSYEAKLQAAGVPSEFSVVDSTLHATQIAPWVWNPTVAFLSVRAPHPTPTSSWAHPSWWAYGLLGLVLGAAAVGTTALVRRRRRT
jgi:acetyl esterase/lipase